jgi:hypothetical protein
LADGRLRIDRTASVEAVEEDIDLLESGAMDAAPNERRPPVDSERTRLRLSDSVEFSHEDRKRRHGMRD